MVQTPIVHSESSNKVECAESDGKSDYEESKYVYDTIDRNHRFSKEHDIIKYVTKETSNWMQICDKTMDDNIYPGPKEPKKYELLQDETTNIFIENLADTNENEKVIFDELHTRNKVNI